MALGAICVLPILLRSTSLSAQVAGGHPAWSPSDDQIALERIQNGESRVLVLALGSRRVSLMGDPRYGNHHPAWSPDGTEIAFHAGVGDAREIFVLRLEDRSVRRLTDTDAPDTAPHWSPSGNRMVFYSDRSGTYRLWLLNLGTNATELIPSGR